VTNATVRRDLVALSSVINYTIDQTWLETNPVLARMKRIEERRDPIINPPVTQRTFLSLTCRPLKLC